MFSPVVSEEPSYSDGLAELRPEHPWKVPLLSDVVQRPPPGDRILTTRPTDLQDVSLHQDKPTKFHV